MLGARSDQRLRNAFDPDHACALPNRGHPPAAARARRFDRLARIFRTPRKTITPSTIRRLSLATLTLVAALGVVVFRLLDTRTTFGRNFDVSAIQNGLALGGSALNSSNAVLTAISAVSFALIGGLLVVFSLLERRLDLAGAVLIMLGGSFASTEYLKGSLPERSGVPDYLANGFPSGHSTVALALGLAFVLAAPVRQNRIAAIGAALYAAGMGAALVFNAWHLPSDVGGGFCVATAWAAASAQLVRRPLERGVPHALSASRSSWWRSPRTRRRPSETRAVLHSDIARTPVRSRGRDRGHRRGVLRRLRLTRSPNARRRRRVPDPRARDAHGTAAPSSARCSPR